MDFEGNRQFAKYNSFRMAGEAEKYRLLLGAFAGGSAGECPAWAGGLGCSTEGPASRPPLPLSRGEWRRPPDGALPPYMKKCDPHLMVPPGQWDPFSRKCRKGALLLTATIGTNRDRVITEPISVDPGFLIHGAWCSWLSNLGTQGQYWPPSKTGCLPAGRDRRDSRRSRSLYQRASVHRHPLELCSARPEVLVTAVLPRTRIQIKRPTLPLHR